MWLSLMSGCAPLQPFLELDAYRGEEQAFATMPVTGRGETDVRVLGEVVLDVPYEVREQTVIVEGDMVFGDPPGRSATVTSRSSHWVDCEVPYELDSSLTAEIRSEVLRAVAIYEEHTALRFVEDRSRQNRLDIYSGQGCWSWVGRRTGVQDLSLDPDCTGTALHEIGHALGLWHEQSRTDAPDHVTVHPENISEGNLSAFANYLERGEDGRNHGPYDVDSVMHYGSNFFLRPGRTCTPSDTSGCSLTTLDGRYIEANRWTLTDGDIAALVQMYGDDVCRVVGPDEDAGDTVETAHTFELSAVEPRFTHLEDASEGDRDVFTFTLAEATRVVARTEGENDTRAELWDADGAVVASDSGTETEPHFALDIWLEAGTYSLVIDLEGVFFSDLGYTLTVSAPEQLRGTYIARYHEGPTGEAAVEMVARNQPADLSDCVLEVYPSAGVFDIIEIPLFGQLEPGQGYAICNVAAQGLGCQQVDARLAFDGDDAVVLRCNGIPSDRVGQLGQDPGDAWVNDAGVASIDHTLERRCDVEREVDVWGSTTFDGWFAVEPIAFGSAWCLPEA